MNLRKATLILLVFSGCVSCSQWKVSALKGKRIINLPAGIEAKQISLRTAENDLMDISFNVRVSREKVLVADNKMKRLQVFDMDGSPDLVIGPKKNDRTAQDMTVPFNFGLIGEMARDSEGKIFIQNRIDSGTAPQAVMAPPTQDDLETMPSYILVFDKTGKLQYTMGQKGAADLPFYYIENITVDEKDRLFVISKSLNSWNIFRFRAKGRDFYVNIGKDIFHEKEGQDEFKGIIENIVPFRSGDKLLASVAYYQNTRFKYRKIYEYSIKDSSFGKPVFTIQDPKNELFSIMDDKYVLLWDTEEKDVRFVIWDFDGNIVNNLKIANDAKKSNYREIISDEAGEILLVFSEKNRAGDYRMEMTRCVTADEMKLIEERAMSSLFGISAQILMSLAGKAIADEVKKRFSPDDEIAVVCGRGNNGGDGYAAAVFLSAAGYKCTVWQAEKNNKEISPESASFLSLCINRNLLTSTKPDFREFRCLIDCLTGIGLKGAIRPECAVIISEMNSAGAFIIAADIPSGLRADGVIDKTQPIVKASVTVTMGIPKINCVQYPGRFYTGTLITADIGIPCDITAEHNGHTSFIMDKDGFRKIRFNAPSFDVHKYENGHLAVIGGFKGMEGAAILAADAAFNTGAGLVTIYTEEQSRSAIAGIIPEAMTAALPAAASDETLHAYFKDEFTRKKIRALLIGCGMGRELYQERVFHAALESAAGLVPRIIIDGDALWFLARSDIHPKRNGSELILTPHIGECSRLLDREAADIEKDIHGAAMQLSSLFDCTAVVKGATTVTAGKERSFINMSGNPALATAGSGDVLAGICGALQMKKLSPDIACAASVYIHGAAADLIVERTGADIIRSSEIKHEIRTIIYSG